ncbi:MAG: flagellar export protein FliJ [Firmicutes bacterium]|nr:flagellar export protein FliJ [Bacillota bacterium]
MYQFPLQKVLEYRQHLEEKEQLRLAQVQLQTQQARLNVVKAKEVLSQGQEAYSRCQVQLDVSEALLASEYVIYLEKRLQAYQEALAKQEKRLQQQIKVTEKAMQERKIMDKLREKDFQRYQQEQAKIEQRHMDEAARNVFLRQKHNE